MDIYRDGELFLYGYVGDNYWDEGFTASDVLMALAEHGRDVDLVVHINSGGGVVDDGVAIYNALSLHRGNVQVVVDAIAASSASVIAMAGDEIIMRAGSLMMIHDPSNLTYGTSADHAKTIEQLEAYATQMASIYAERSGQTVVEARNIMKEERWMTAAQAVELGFANTADAAKSTAVAAFDFRAYAKAPKTLKTLAAKKRWSIEHPKQGATASVPTAPKEIPVAESNTTPPAVDPAAVAAAVKADRDRRKAIMSLPEAEGRATLAAYFADDTEDAIEKVKAALAASPKAQASGTGVDPAEYEKARIEGAAGAGLGAGAKPDASAAKAGWGKVAARINDRNGKGA